MPTASDERVPAPTRERRRSRPRQRASAAVRTVRPPNPVEAAVVTTSGAGSVAGVLRRHRAIAAVLGLFAVSALIVPTMTPAPIGDDWVYARSVEILFREGDLRVLDLSVVTLVFQVVWGTIFGALFGLTFGALRLSTVTLVFLSGLACYGLCRELGVDRGRSALGAAAYLFNPLAFVLAFSFMSDPHFTALLVIASLGYVRGLRPDTPGRPDGADRLALLGGSVAAACAFLVRQQGALIPPAVVLALLLGGRLRLDRSGLCLVGRIAAAPAVTVAGYYLWLVFVHGVPEWQASFVADVRAAGWDASWLLIQRMTFIELMYVGLFTLPLAAGALVAIGGLARVRSALGLAAVAAWGGVLLVGTAVFAGYGRDIPPMPRMPYVPQYLGTTGLGPTDIQGGRAWLVGWGALDWLTATCAVASLLFALALARRIARPRRPDATRGGAAIVLAIMVGQMVGVFPPSFHFRDWIISVDRYLLPLLPLALCLGLWTLRDVRLAMPVAWLVVAACGVFAVAGTRDLLVLQEATWRLAGAATEIGIPPTRLDGGASWDGYHLYEYSRANGIGPQTPGGPWWTNLFGPATDSSYVVSTAPLPGYDVLGAVEYSSWLEDDPTYLYLVRRQGLTTLP